MSHSSFKELVSEIRKNSNGSDARGGAAAFERETVPCRFEMQYFNGKLTLVDFSLTPQK